MNTGISVAVRRAVIETNLEQCRDTAARSFVEIGRWLNAAKSEGVVEHGEWAAWVAQHAGMNERTAQRCMQAARELPEGSALEMLGITKLRALLTLPAGEREEAAREMDAANATSAQVERAVAERNQARRDRDEALRLVEQQKKRIELLNQKQHAAVDAAVRDAVKTEREEARAQMEAVQRDLSQRESRIAGLRREKTLAEKNAQRAEQALGEVRGALMNVENERMALRAQLEEANAGGGISEEARAQIEALSRRHAQAEAEIDRLTELLDEAQTAAARGSLAAEQTVSPVTRILSAIGGLMAHAGHAPGELADLRSPLGAEDRAILISQAETVGQWAMQIIAICGGGGAQ